MRFLIVCYAAGLMVGCVSLIEWLVSRLARLWLVSCIAGVIVWLASAVSLAVLKRNPKTPR